MKFQSKAIAIDSAAAVARCHETPKRADLTVASQLYERIHWKNA
jgi:hypothetical protein